MSACCIIVQTVSRSELVWSHRRGAGQKCNLLCRQTWIFLRLVHRQQRKQRFL